MKTTSVTEALAGILEIIMNTVITSTNRANSGSRDALQLAEPDADSPMDSGESEFIN